ncbi:prepilin-type N-terminal cleavage/methylation domain-containing protein [uncultured Massilia sp.]|uniref:prepilin-type N-terminal cleavage/methylation domain-containing protein n=1 Tax=uncultured Massilia sp. TaxID=169973 RepID=UPI0025FBEB2C|nr:prepilin-type N-terminal cleavage/methylation domain-containing protein [uncultured Massilia sp.]
MWNKRSAGVTLIELIVALVIVGVAIAGAVAAFSRADIGSANPAVAQQMAAVADSMMEEVLLKPFNRPAGNTGPPASNQRRDFVVVDDYNAYASTGILDVEGNAIPGLAAYSVRVDVAPVQGGLHGIPQADTRMITVTVRNASMPQPFVLTGWRTQPLLPGEQTP